ncbi:BTB/POZ domain-containing protein [Hibiscus syriacus]|uniref:BTB/POZ domain-containing protein n=1 Tax=Hibiscus syriacus TaxID=106335 RepID=A0A6A3AFB4_HIBSY|nr:BTB/POZ domain-containing protein At5g03250-like [Hibiscus syriacus]KAE8702503.1 BTB/POZ domain-containing protein [Hibiscus syriacus]
MALLRLGSKPETFHREGNSWICTSGLPNDVDIYIGEMSFHLHKFPLLSRSGMLRKLIEECCTGDGASFSLRLDDLPGGAKAFELISKFCYGVKIELTAHNIVSVRCAAEYLEMTDDNGDENLVLQTEFFLEEVLGTWADSIRALEACEEVMPYAEELHIVSRCIDSLAMKACEDPSIYGWPLVGRESKQSPENNGLWNGISTPTKTKTTGDNWWFEDVTFLSLPIYKRLILAIESRGTRPESIAASVAHYARRYLPLVNRQSSFDDANQGTNIPKPSEADQRVLLEEIVGLMPNKKGVTSSKLLIRLLRTAMVLHASPSCRENLEKRVGAQLDQASLVDLLIPNMSYSETLYDVNRVQRILDHFLLVEQASAIATPDNIVEEEQLMNRSDSLGPMTMVARLVDGFLAEVAQDVNFKLPKFEALAARIPDYARQLDDGLYHAIDIHLKAHPWITDGEREQLCRLMNCEKLSIEASTHAAQNERLPLRVIVQVLFFEQLRLRTSISGWFFLSDNLENSAKPNGNLGVEGYESHPTIGSAEHNATDGEDDVKHRVCELEKDCSSMKEEIQKLVKAKRSWKNFTRRLGFNKSQSCCSKRSKPSDLRATPSSVNKQQNCENIEVVPGTLKVI